MHTINYFGVLPSIEKEVLQTTLSKFSIMQWHDKLAKLPVMSLLVRLISLITVISLGTHCASR